MEGPGVELGTAFVSNISFSLVFQLNHLGYKKCL